PQLNPIFLTTGIAVDQFGRLYIGGLASLNRFDGNGAFLGQLFFGDSVRITDVAIDEQDRLAVVYEDGWVGLGNVWSGPLTGFLAAGDPFYSTRWPIFVTFGHHVAPPTPTPVPTPVPTPASTPVPQLINRANILVSVGAPFSGPHSSERNFVRELTLDGTPVQ